jgi:DNA invertase Pin-like site-specific DNA recombinase
MDCGHETAMFSGRAVYILGLLHLRKAGLSAKNLYTDKITGTKAERPGLEQALSHLREGDAFVVWRLDRLGRSLKHLIEIITALQEQHIAFKSITENIDTSTATGQLVFHLFGALAEFERNLITERSMAGLQAARARGRKGGRLKLNPSVSKVAMAKKLYADQTNSTADICRTLHISRATLCRYLKGTPWGLLVLGPNPTRPVTRGNKGL